jgi:hypothetical protein
MLLKVLEDKPMNRASTKYKSFCMEFRVDGSLKKVRGGALPSDTGHFYDDKEFGFGGCVMAKDEKQAKKTIREEVLRRRVSKKQYS